MGVSEFIDEGFGVAQARQDQTTLVIIEQVS
jgi:hypothetical protein